jgi:hypothetical protein
MKTGGSFVSEWRGHLFLITSFSLLLNAFITVLAGKTFLDLSLHFRG